MTSELDRGIGIETELSPEDIKMQQFYDAYRFLEFHPIFNTTPGETIDLTASSLGIQIVEVFGLDPADESLKTQPVNSYAFDRSLDVMVVKVNPQTNEVDGDATKNTKVRVWLEAGPWDPNVYEGVLSEEEIAQLPENQRGAFTHDTNLDCGGDTFEDAIIELARLVKQHYPIPEEQPQAA